MLKLFSKEKTKILKYALLVGVGNYDDGSLFLKCPSHDLKAIDNLLSKSPHNFDYIDKMLDKTNKEVENGVEDFVDKIKLEQENDDLLEHFIFVYVSSHGFSNGETLFFIPREFDGYPKHDITTKHNKFSESVIASILQNISNKSKSEILNSDSLIDSFSEIKGNIVFVFDVCRTEHKLSFSINVAGENIKVEDKNQSKAVVEDKSESKAVLKVYKDTELVESVTFEPEAIVCYSTFKNKESIGSDNYNRDMSLYTDRLIKELSNKRNYGEPLLTLISKVTPNFETINCWGDVIWPVGSKSKYERIQMQKLFFQSDHEKNVCFNKPDIIDNFVHRNDLAKKISDELMRNIDNLSKGSNELLALIGISGMGGVGKTTLAAWIMDHPPFDYVFKAWILADSKQNLINDYLRLGSQFGFFDKIKEKLNNEQKAMVVKDTLDKKYIYFDVRPIDQIEEIEELSSSTLFYNNKFIFYFDKTRKSIYVIRGSVKEEVINRVIELFKDDNYHMSKIPKCNVISDFSENERSILKKVRNISSNYSDLSLSEVELAKLICVCQLSCTFLLVFDNVKKLADVRKYLPKNCQIITTSRNPSWKNKIDIDVMSKEESIKLFRTIVTSDSCYQDEEIGDLINELGNLPLAITQASIYFNQMKEYSDDITIADYIKKYRKRTREAKEMLLDEDYSTNDILPVYITWDMNIADIMKKCKLAFEVLCFLSYLYPDNIPTLLIKEYLKRKKSEVTVEKIIRILCSFSLIRHDKVENVISIHRVIQNIIQIKIKLQDMNIDQKMLVQVMFSVLNYYYKPLRPRLQKSKEGYMFDFSIYRKEQVGKEGKLRKSVILNGYSVISNILDKDVKFDLDFQTRFAIRLFSYCCEVGDKGVFKYYLNNGITIKMKDFNRKDCLLNSCSGGCLEFSMYLLKDRKCNHKVVDKDGNNCLLLAAESGNLDLVIWLIENKYSKINATNKLEQNILLISCKFGHLKTVEWIFKQCTKDTCIECNGSKFDILDQDKDGNSAFHFAALSGNEELFMFLYDKKVCNQSIQWKNENGETCLLLCSKKGSLKLVKLLLENKHSDIVEVDRNGFTSVINACVSGNLDLVKYLVKDKKMNPTYEEIQRNLNSLGHAAENGYLNIMRWLLKESGFEWKDEDIQIVFSGVCFGGYIDIVKWLCSNYQINFRYTASTSDSTAVLVSAGKGHFETVKYLIEECDDDLVKDRDKYGNTLLLCSCGGGNIKLVKWLLQKGYSSINEKSNDGVSAVLKACFMGHLELVKWLIEEGGANKNDKDDLGYSLLLKSCKGKKNINLIRWLIEEGYSDVRENSGFKHKKKYALHILAESTEGFDVDVIKMLVKEFSADINVYDAFGFTPRFHALTNDNKDMYRWIKSEGGGFGIGFYILILAIFVFICAGLFSCFFLCFCCLCCCGNCWGDPFEIKSDKEKKEEGEDP